MLPFSLIKVFVITKQMAYCKSAHEKKHERADQQQQSQASWIYTYFEGHASTYRFWNLVKESRV
jgi:hypothetical protein